MDHSLGALLAQKNNEGVEQAIYYLSRIFTGAESHYKLIEKECLALVFAIRRHEITVDTLKGQTPRQLFNWSE